MTALPRRQLGRIGRDIADRRSEYYLASKGGCLVGAAPVPRGQQSPPAGNLSDHVAMGVFDVFQIPYSAVEREHETLLTAAAKAGAGIVIRGGAAKGVLLEGSLPADVYAEAKRRLDAAGSTACSA